LQQLARDMNNFHGLMCEDISIVVSSSFGQL